MRFLMLLLVTSILTACTGTGGGRVVPMPGDIPVGMAPTAATAVVEGFRPVKARVHPLSRIEQDLGGERRLVLQLELTDAAGHSVKWPGIARVELDGATVADQRVWWSDLRDAGINSKAFDGITRTYILRIAPLTTGTEPVRAAVTWTQADASGAPESLATPSIKIEK